MSVSGGSPAYWGATAILLLIAVSLIIGSPAAAALVITNESFSPVPPLAWGDGQHAVIAITVIPAGATTFSQTHTLQMQTDLVNARWNIQVIVDGVPAAHQSASGTSAFVNGYLLSYPTTADVSFTVTLNGTVPSGTGINVTILQVTELDTSGMPVPGSSRTVAAPLIIPSQGTVTLPQVTIPAPAAATPVPTHSPGFLPVTGLVAAVIAAAGYVSLRSRRK
jgi:hypothetical protein